MTDRRVVAAALLLGGCPRRAPPAPPVALDVVDVFDAPAPQPDVTAPPRDALRATDVFDAPRPVARGGPWRTLPRVDLTGVTPLGRWDEAPDRDGDELPDAMLAVHWNSVAARCTPVNALRSCPRPDPDDAGPDARDGAFTLGYLTLYSGDVAEGDAGPPIARVLGTRRVWRASSTPLATLRGVEFTEFGGGVITRAVLEVTDGAGANDVIDVADLFVGAGAERHVGAMVHHCRTPRRGAAARGGSLALWDFSLAPLVFRAAMAHPFSGCAAELAPWERDVAAAFSNGLTVTVTHDEPVSARGPRVGIAVDPLRMVELDAAPEANPLRANDLEVLGVERVCRGDRVRWRVGAQRCAAVIPRDDAPVQGCAGAVTALDPTRAEPVAVVAHGDAAADLLFTRGAGLLRVTLPRECRRHVRLDGALEHRGEVPPRVAASRSGGRVFFARGHDLWMWSRGRLSPVLVNGPASGLPRGTARALAFLDARTVAAVISNHLVTFTFELSPDGADPPELIDADAHLLRAPRVATPSRSGTRHRRRRRMCGGGGGRALTPRGPRTRCESPRWRRCGNVSAMSAHAKLIRRARMDTTLPPLHWSESLTRALRPASAVVMEWRSPIGHVVLIEPDLARLEARSRAFITRAVTAESAEDAAALGARCARPENHPRAMVIEASRIVQVETLDPAAPSFTRLRAPTGDAIALDAWMRVEPGELSVPPGSFFATLLARRAAPPSTLTRDALITAEVRALEDDEADEHAGDEALLRELLTERFAEQESAAEDHLRATALRRGITDEHSGAYQP